MLHDAIITGIRANLPEILSLRSMREKKDDGSYVTKGDLLVERIIFNVIAAEFPAASIISEERKNDELPEDCVDVLVVDPIDGTENFTSGFMEWGISVCHYRNGKHHQSLLYCPELGTSLRSGDHITRCESRIRGLSSSLSMEDLIKATQGYEYRIMGCCVYNMLNVIRGSFCSFENPKGACSWDILAGLNLALEHGLSVTVNSREYHGEYLDHTQKYRFKIEG